MQVRRASNQIDSRYRLLSVRLALPIRRAWHGCLSIDRLYSPGPLQTLLQFVTFWWSSDEHSLVHMDVFAEVVTMHQVGLIYPCTYNYCYPRYLRAGNFCFNR